MTDLAGHVLQATPEQLRQIIALVDDDREDFHVQWLLSWAEGNRGFIVDTPGADDDTAGPATPERVLSYFETSRE